MRTRVGCGSRILRRFALEADLWAISYPSRAGKETVITIHLAVHFQLKVQ